MAQQHVLTLRCFLLEWSLDTLMKNHVGLPTHADLTALITHFLFLFSHLINASAAHNIAIRLRAVTKYGHLMTIHSNFGAAAEGTETRAWAPPPSISCAPLN